MTEREGRLFRKKKTVVWTILCLAAALLLSAVPTVFSLLHVRDAVRDTLVTVSLPLGKCLDTAGVTLRRTLSEAGNRKKIIQEQQEKIDALEREMASLRGQMGEISSLREENDQLRALLALKKQTADVQWLDAAEILSLRNVDGGQYTLDRGSVDGVCEGAAVLNATGLFGFVSQVGQSRCTVRPIGKSETAIGVINERTGAVGVLFCEENTVNPGQGTDLVIRYIRSAGGEQTADDFAVGDEIFTADGNPLCPAGLSIGRVSAAGQDQMDGTWFAQVTPSDNVGSPAARYLIVTGTTDGGAP